MSVMALQTEISLQTACEYPACSTFSFPLYRKLWAGNYDRCSVMPVVALDEWRSEHRTARKRADRAYRRGYRFVDVIHHERVDEIHAINTSASFRQGRPMSSGYLVRPSETPDDIYPCFRHGVHRYGIEHFSGLLVAYLWLYRAGDLALVSSILGHQAYLEAEIMYLLWQGMVERESGEPGFIVYNRHDSGTDGLRFYKERVGLAETSVEWLP